MTGAARADDWPNTSRILPWCLAAFLAVLWFVPIDSIVLEVTLPIDATPDRVLLFGLIVVAVAFTATAARGRGPKFACGLPGLALIAFIVIAILSLVANAPRLASLEEFDSAAKRVGVLLIYAAFFFAAIALMRPSEVPRFAALVVGLASVTAVGVIYEYRSGTNLFFDWSSTLLPAGFDVGNEPADPEFGRELINGPTEHAISAATMFAMALPFAIMGFVRSKVTRDRVLFAIATALILGASFATIRKTGAVGMGIAVLVLFLYRPRIMFRLLPYGLVALIVIQAGAPGSITRLKAQFWGGNLTEEGGTAKGRTRDYGPVSPDILQHPVIGRGHGSYTPDQYRFLDNEYLQRLVETGIIGAIVYLHAGAGDRRHRPPHHPLQRPGPLDHGDRGGRGGGGLRGDERHIRPALVPAGSLHAPVRRRPRGRHASQGDRGGRVGSAQSRLAQATARPAGRADLTGVAELPREESPAPVGPPRDVVFAFSYVSWTAARRRGMHFAEDRLAEALLESPAVGRILVADPYRSRAAAVLRGHGEDEPFPETDRAALVQPLRLRRRDPHGLPGVRGVYRRYEGELRAAAERMGLKRPAVITTHPILAGLGSFEWAGPVTFYAVNDWAAHPEYQPWRGAIEASYKRVREHGRRVCAVTETILERIRPTGAAEVVPNGVDPREWDRFGPPPGWLRELPGPRILYVGTIDDRLDGEPLARVADAHPSGTLILVGPRSNRASLDWVETRPNVRVRSALSREELAVVMATADVGLVPHVDSALTRAMSPLKLYEYLAAGAPVAGFDLPGMRGVSPRVSLAPPGGDLAEAVERALALGRAAEPDRRRFIAENSWQLRHEQILRTALA